VAFQVGARNFTKGIAAVARFEGAVEGLGLSQRFALATPFGLRSPVMVSLEICFLFFSTFCFLVVVF